MSILIRTSWPTRWKRFPVWLLVPMFAAVGAVAVATPSHAATTCTTTYRLVGSWAATETTPAGFHGEITIHNTGTAPTTGWLLSIEFGLGTSMGGFWNMQRLDLPFGITLYRNLAFNGVIQPGRSTTAGFIARKQLPWGVNFPTRITVSCV